MSEIRTLYSEHLDAYHVFTSHMTRLGTVGRKAGAWREVSGRGNQVFHSKSSYPTLTEALLAVAQRRYPFTSNLLEAGDGRWLINAVPGTPELPTVAQGPAVAQPRAAQAGMPAVPPLPQGARKRVSRSGKRTASSRPLRKRGAA